MAGPTILRDYHTQLLDTMREYSSSFKWWSAPLNLGGSSGASGGSGVPLGGIFGQLIQSKIAYDTTELAYSGLPVPSGASILDNLAHIRYDINQLSGGTLSEIREDGVEIITEATILDFDAEFDITDEGGGIAGIGYGTLQRIHEDRDNYHENSAITHWRSGYAPNTEGINIGYQEGLTGVYMFQINLKGDDFGHPGVLAVGPDSSAYWRDRFIDVDGDLTPSHVSIDRLFGIISTPSIIPSVTGKDTLVGVYGRADIGKTYSNPASGIAFLAETPQAYKAKYGHFHITYGLYVADQDQGIDSNYAVFTNLGLVSFGDDVIFRQAATIGTLAGDLTIDGAANFAIQDPTFIDVTSTEAFLVRKNTDGGDVFIVDTTNGRVGIGTAPDATLEVITELRVTSTESQESRFALIAGGNTSDAVLNMYDKDQNLDIKFSTVGDSYLLGGNFGIGTVPDNPLHVFVVTPISSNDVIQYPLKLEAKDTSGGFWNRVGVGIQFENTASSGAFISAEIIGRLTATAGADGEIVVRTRNSDVLGDVAIFENSGHVIFGNTITALGQVHIDQSSASGAIPVLFLDQGDDSEQLIKGSYSGADVDMTIIELDVTGAPKFGWSETPDVFTLNKGLAVGDAGVTNYANFAGDGELTLFGTARVTSQIPIDNANLGKGNTAPTQIIIGDYNSWEYDINDDTVFTFHIPHDWAAGTAITISIDWFIDQAYVTNSGEVKWQIVWAATPHDASEPLDGPTHTGTADTGDINIPAIAKAIKEDGLTIAGASLSTEDQVGVTISRIALTDGNNPSGNVDPAIVDIHIQYIADKLGEAT